MQTVLSASAGLGWAGLGCPASLHSCFLGLAPDFVTAASTSAKQALQWLAVLRAVVTQPLPRVILL